MVRPMLRGAAAAALSILMLGLYTPAQAQSYPTKNVNLIVSIGPGTGMDVLARLYAEKLAQSLGRPVVVENKPGAATMLAATHVAQSEPDGHTMVILTSSALAINQHLYKKLNYNPETDFTPISLYVKSPLILAVNPKLPIKDVKEFTRRLLAGARDVFGVAAAVLVDAVGRQLQHAVGQRGQEVPVVRDEQHRALVLRQRRDQHLLGRHVEMVGRLVEHQEVRRDRRASCAITSRAFSPPDSTRHFFSTSSPEKPKQPASVRSEPCPACGKASSSVSNTVRSPSSSSMACWAK
jgi:tripartite-type tricarboxylate transporter receptor subunit TctC